MAAIALATGVSAAAVSFAAEGQRPRDDAMRQYLQAERPAQITRVAIDGNTIAIHGQIPPSDATRWKLVELPPHQSSIDADDSVEVASIDTPGSFKHTVERIADGRDRLLSRWAVISTDATGAVLTSHARYAEDPTAPPRQPAASKKGMAGVHSGDDLPELLELGVKHITVNVHLEKLISLAPEGAIEHRYCGKTYYFAPDTIEQFDKVFGFATQNDMVASAILLVPRLDRKTELGRLLTHPDAVDGHFSMPNVATAEGAQFFAAVIDFLAARYSRDDEAPGRITNWILGNEIDAGWIWTNSGEKTAHEYMDEYTRALRMVHAIVRSHDPHSIAFVSLTHFWAQPFDPSPLRYYAGRELLEILQRQCEVEGNFNWGVAHHPYPQDLFNSRFWEDTLAHDDFETPKITFKNVAVLDRWLHQPRYRFNDRVRTVLLSEQGFHTPDYSAEAEQVQAAALALSWRKVQPLESVEAYHYHRWIDHPHEGGLRLGFRRLADPNAAELHPKKFSWNVFRALGTPDEPAATEFARPIVGDAAWKSP